MAYHIYFRILGYVTTIVLHVGNMAIMAAPKPKELAADPRIRAFSNMQSRYLTCWTFFLQIVYAVAGLWCDILILKKNSNTKNYELPKHLKGFRNVLFAAIIWPSSLIVFSLFWTLFLYDRSLVFPAFLDKVLSSTSNHIMHTAVLPIVIWEVIFRPRRVPKSHTRNLLHIAFHFVLYFCVLCYTYIERGTWVYPILGKAYGTIYFYLFIGIVAGLSVFYYYVQWPLTTLIWGSLEQTKRKIR